VSDLGPGGYSGTSWIDIDGDDDLDLFINNTFLFRNDGNGVFVKITSTLGATQPVSTGNGQTWADYDNDGDIDVFISSLTSILYQNQGSGTFTPITKGDIGESVANRGWAATWADFDNDGFVDLFISHPAGFVGSATTNHFLHNQGDGRFTKIDTGAAVSNLAAHTVPTWSDFDNDGDMDLFIGSGPANGTLATDNLFQNMLKETGKAFLKRITSSPIATTKLDGQVWNWIDYDNDGDLDAYVTNWFGGQNSGKKNFLFRNNSGSFSRNTAGAIVNDVEISLSSVWGDFDNDGDLDAYVANDRSQLDRFYRNNGDGTFEGVTTLAVTEALTHRGASAGDFDNDGDLDLIAIGSITSLSLFRNDTNNGNNWLSVKTVGMISNKSGIGAKVRAKSTIFGTAIWQLREISSQNSFNGMNSLRAHFGLGDAAIVDSLIIEWPSGEISVVTNVSINQRLTVTEEIPTSYLRANSAADTISGTLPFVVNFEDLSIADPNTPITSREWDFDGDGVTDSDIQNPTWTYDANGQYTVTLAVTNGSTADTLTRENYIIVQDAVSAKDENLALPTEYRLKQNYPNPFNPTTTIEYELANVGNVKLIIYNLFGQEVARLVDEIKSTGKHNVIWDASRFSSGIYYYRIEAEHFSETRKLILLK